MELIICNVVTDVRPVESHLRDIIKSSKYYKLHQMYVHTSVTRILNATNKCVLDGIQTWVRASTQMKKKVLQFPLYLPIRTF